MTFFYFLPNSLAPKMSVNKNKTTKMKNKTFAIPAALAAMPVKPNSAATIATTKKINAQRNITYSFRIIHAGIEIIVPNFLTTLTVLKSVI
jgi:hypothetical protein